MLALLVVEFSQRCHNLFVWRGLILCRNRIRFKITFWNQYDKSNTNAARPMIGGKPKPL